MERAEFILMNGILPFVGLVGLSPKMPRVPIHREMAWGAPLAPQAHRSLFEQQCPPVEICRPLEILQPPPKPRYNLNSGAIKTNAPPNIVAPNPNPPYRGKPGAIIDPTKVDIYRGGVDLKVKPGEVKISGGKVQPTHGVSLETNPCGLDKFGGAKKVVSIPDELQIIQRGGRDVHFEIVPKQPMSLERFQELVNQVKLE